MKKKYLFLLFVNIIPFFHFGCIDEDTIPELPLNEHLLFINSYELDINASPDANNFPLFDISNIKQDKIFIAVGREPFVVMNNEVQNKDAIIWHWNTGMESITQIAFSNGVLGDSTLAGSQSICCNGDTYYWAAWAWDASGKYIAASTSNHSFTIEDNAKPDIIIENTVLVYESGGDGFIQKQETIRLKFFVKNIGDATARNVLGTFSHPLISTMPSILNFGTLTPNQTHSAELEFIVPNVANLDLLLDVDFLFNENIETDTFVYQPITLLPCVKQIYLEWTARSLNMDYINVGADIYLTVFANNIQLLQTSPIYDITNNMLPVYWFYAPCGQYYLSETFSFQFMDYDDVGADDYIGTIGVNFGEWAAQKSFPSDTTIQNNEVALRFEIDWK